METAVELGDGAQFVQSPWNLQMVLQRGMKVVDLGRTISVPVGPETLGRVFNVLGDTIDLKEPFPADFTRHEIHKPAPKFEELKQSIRNSTNRD